MTIEYFNLNDKVYIRSEIKLPVRLPSYLLQFKQGFLSCFLFIILVLNQSDNRIFELKWYSL